jgi:alkanesulfonate monooxygenase SsuD/methylene tetrahydromethanopterin reductase-like flavin-dependent oxidoreductase (luciferase family)
MVEIGVVISSPLPAGTMLPDVAQLARDAESLGLDCIWAEDLLHRGDGAVLDVTCVLSACAAATESIYVGSAIFAPSLRNLSWALKQVATVNLLARGRFRLGVALGSSSEEEYRLAGLTRSGQRERTEEFLSILSAWAQEDVDKLAMSATARTLLLGADGPAPPLWVGGTSSAALRRAARFGEGWLSGSQTPTEFGESLSQLRQFAEQGDRPCPQAGIVLCAAVGTSGDAMVEASAQMMQALYGTPAKRAAELAIGGTPQQVADQILRYVDAGAEQIAVVSAALPWSESWPMLAEVRRLLVEGQ